MPIYDYECTQGHRFESFSSMAERDNPIECPECKEVATAVISPVRSHLSGTDPGLPGAWMKWEKKRAQKMAQEKKQNS